MKNFIALITLSFAPISGMNYNPWEHLCSYQSTSFSIIPYEMNSHVITPTQIIVRQASLFQVNSDTALTVIGLHQQHFAGSKNGFFNMASLIPNPLIRASSDKEILYEHNPYDNEKTPYIPLMQKAIHPILEIVEPIILDNVYRTYRSTSNPLCNPAMFSFEGKNAVNEVEKDLALCYHKALFAGLSRLEKYYIKDIAFPVLSANEYFPPNLAILIGIRSILLFLKKNPNQYNNIIFFTENKADFELYKELLTTIQCNNEYK